MDESCIDCDTCRWMQGDTFVSVEGKSAVVRQPKTEVIQLNRCCFIGERLILWVHALILCHPKEGCIMETPRRDATLAMCFKKEIRNGRMP